MKTKTSPRRLRRERIKKHIRKQIKGTPECPRLSVFRSLRSIYAQLIDDTSQTTLFTVSSLSKSLSNEIKKSKGKVEVAKIVGRTAGEKAKERKIDKVVFDRNGYLFHGRVKAVAEGAREAGLKF